MLGINRDNHNNQDDCQQSNQ